MSRVLLDRGRFVDMVHVAVGARYSERGRGEDRKNCAESWGRSSRVSSELPASVETVLANAKATAAT